jgi:hypothetical protein
MHRPLLSLLRLCIVPSRFDSIWFQYLVMVGGSFVIFWFSTLYYLAIKWSWLLATIACSELLVSDFVVVLVVKGSFAILSNSYRLFWLLCLFHDTLSCLDLLRYACFIYSLIFVSNALVWLIYASINWFMTVFDILMFLLFDAGVIGSKELLMVVVVRCRKLLVYVNLLPCWRRFIH